MICRLCAAAEGLADRCAAVNDMMARRAIQSDWDEARRLPESMGYVSPLGLQVASRERL
ncbi:MAG: hypothetical protein GY769_08175 [bacterium]|nr:hypothetical protein [bacterium]